jgi:hypothetical protein
VPEIRNQRRRLVERAQHGRIRIGPARRAPLQGNPQAWRVATGGVEEGARGGSDAVGVAGLWARDSIEERCAVAH